MAQYFLESSAFIKRYKTENGTHFVSDLFNAGNDLFFLNLSLIEIHKVFYRLWKYPLQQDIQQNAKLDQIGFNALTGRFAADLQEQFMHRIEFTEEMVQNCSIILETTWVPNVFDLVQLSAFLITKQEYPDIVFVCSDLRSNLVSATRKFVPNNEVILPS